MEHKDTLDISWITAPLQRSRFLKYIRTGYRIEGNHLVRNDGNGIITYILMYRRQFAQQRENPDD